MPDWVLVPCPGRRVAELYRLLEDLEHPISRVCVVTTLPDPVRPYQSGTGRIGHLINLGEEIHYGKWINAGLAHIAAFDEEARYVFVTGSDTRANAQTIPLLVAGAEEHGFTMCGPDPWKLGTVTLELKTRNVHYRVPPEFFLLDMRLGLRMDEQFRWWYSDDDLEMQARQRGPVGLISGVYAEQKLGGHDMSEQVEQWAKEDRIKFAAKWGREPW